MLSLFCLIEFSLATNKERKNLFSLFHGYKHFLFTGFPITNCRIYLLNSEGSQVSEGQIGEIFAAGLNLASGYVGGTQQDKFVSNTLSQDQGEYGVK